MRKIFSLIAAVLFAGSMMAADAKVVLDFTDAAWGFPADYSNTEATYENGDYSVVFTPGTTGNGLKYLTVSQTDPTSTGIIFGQTNSSITLPAMSFAVSTIRVHYVSAQGGANTKHNIFVGEDAVSTEETGCKVTDTKTYSEFKIAEGKQAANTVYVLKVTSKHNMQVSKVEFFEVVAGAPEEPTFSIPAGVYNAAQSVELACTTEGAEIHYTLDGTDPTATSAEYSAPIAVAVTTTVKAVAIKNGISSNVVSATYTIVDLDGDGSKENPFSIADVYALNNTLTGKQWVVGYIVGCAADGGKVSGGEATPSNIALGATVDQTEDIVAVQLASQSDPRAALNLVDNPGNLGAQVAVYGDLQAYFGAPGVKNVTDYEIIGGVTPVEPTDTVEITMTSDVYLNDQTGSQGWWLVDAYNDELEIVLSNAGSIDHVDGTYTAADLDPEYSYLLTETDSINFVSGSVTLATSAEGVFTVIGTLVGTDNIAYEISLTKTPAAHIDMTFGFAEDADGITITPSLDTELWDYYIISASAFETTWGNDADALAGAYATQIGTKYAMTGAEDLVFADLLSYYGAGDFVLLAFGISDAGVTTDVATYTFTLSEAGEGIEEILATGKAVKAVRDGQVVVLKGDKAFNMNGQIMK